MTLYWKVASLLRSRCCVLVDGQVPLGA